MDDTTTRLHPDLPLCWEDTETLRVGFETPLARVRNPSAAAQRLIAALREGLHPSRITSEARRLGGTGAEAKRIIAALAPALSTTASRVPRHQELTERPTLRALLHDDGREVPGLRESLSATGLCSFDPLLDDTHGLELVVHVERFLEPLERAQRWLSEGVPHVLVRFTDQAVHVGPVISAAGAPCHTCCSLDMLGRDAAYPALAAQLYGTRPSTETAAASSMAAAFAAMLIRWWIAGDDAAHRLRAIIPITHGMPSSAPRFEQVAPHPDCSCVELATAARPRQ